MKGKGVRNAVLTAFALTTLALCACGGGGASGGSVPVTHFTPVPTPTPGPSTTPLPGQTKIKHVVIVIQENRSFDNMFHGFPGADFATQGKNSFGETVNLTQVPLDSPYDLNHQYQDARTGIDGGQMDGFNRIGFVYPSGQPPGYHPPANPAYVFVRQSDIQPYFDIAHQYVLADRFFSSDADGSFEGHQYLIAGQAAQSWGTPTRVPWGCDGTGQVGRLDVGGNITGQTQQPCFTYTTLADRVEAKHLAWRYYAPPPNRAGYIWSAFDEISRIRFGPDWTTHVISPQTQFLNDVQAGGLANVTWVVPDTPSSDHPGVPSTTGPSWVSSVVNAVGTSRFWDSTAVFILWDDWGGYFDHVAPQQLDFDGLGMRVPLIVVSPYALAGNVAHTQYEFGSVLKFAEQTFGLAPLAASDARATSFGTDVFDFRGAPRAFTTIASPRGLRYFKTHGAVPGPPDEDL